MACLLSLNKAWKCNHAIEFGIRYAVDFKSLASIAADLLGELKASHPAGMLIRVKIIIIVNLQLSVNDKKVNLMKVYAYGEDALTLWAIKNRLSEILVNLGDETKVDECKIFFRPSFGRGGKGTSNFGEFDFIILAKEKLYLGESKWDGSSEKLKDGLLELRPEQLFRHNVFKWYMDNWTFACPQLTDWKVLILASKNQEPKFPKVEENENAREDKTVPPEGSLLASNIKTVSDIIAKHFKAIKPVIINVLLYMHKGEGLKGDSGPNDFKVVNINYTDALQDNLIEIEL